jgi:hypothetical protein
MKNFKKQYRDLEMEVMSHLRDAINNSDYFSKYIQGKAIKVNVFDYTELVIIDDRLTFLDSNGLHYSIFTDASLEDLIDILNAI